MNQKALGRVSVLLKNHNLDHHTNAKFVYHTWKMTSEIQTSPLPFEQLNQQKSGTMSSKNFDALENSRFDPSLWETKYSSQRTAR